MLSSAQKFKLDRLASKINLERNPICMQCCSKADQVHHLVGRANLSVRWDRRNLISMCFKCHREVHDSPEAEIELTNKYLDINGSTALDELLADSRRIAKGLNYKGILKGL